MKTRIQDAGSSPWTLWYPGFVLEDVVNDDNKGLGTWEGVVTKKYEVGMDDFIVTNNKIFHSPLVVILAYVTKEVKERKKGRKAGSP